MQLVDALSRYIFRRRAELCAVVAASHWITVHWEAGASQDAVLAWGCARLRICREKKRVDKPIGGVDVDNRNKGLDSHSRSGNKRDRRASVHLNRSGPTRNYVSQVGSMDSLRTCRAQMEVDCLYLPAEHAR